MSQAPDYSQPLPGGQVGGGRPMEPHRGTLILVLGLVGFFCCGIPGLVAWIMANGDLKKMDAGAMDPEGRSLTNTGRICGIISVILGILVILVAIAWFVFLGAIWAEMMSEAMEASSRQS